MVYRSEKSKFSCLHELGLEDTPGVWDQALVRSEKVLCRHLEEGDIDSHLYLP